MITCPACSRGELDADGVCTRCKVGVPAPLRIEVNFTRRLPWRQYRRRQDQSEASGLVDYANTKEDKS